MLSKREFDQRALAEIPKIRKIGSARLRSHIDLDDFTQETLTRVFASRDQLRDAEKLSAWTAAIARNLAQEWNLKSISVDSPAEIAKRDLPKPDELMESEERRERLIQALDALDDRDRRALLAYYLDDLNCVDLGTRYGVSHAAARMRLSRARTALRRRLRPLLASVAAIIGRSAEGVIGGFVAMKGAMTIGAAVIAALLIGGYVWFGQGSDSSVPTPVSAPTPNGSTDSEVVLSPRVARVGGESTRETESHVSAGRNKASDAGGVFESAQNGVETPVGLASEEPTLTPEQQRIYNALSRIMPRQRQLAAEATAISANLPTVPPRPSDDAPEAQMTVWRDEARRVGDVRDAKLRRILDEMQSLERELQTLVPEAFTRTTSEQGVLVRVDGDKLRAAAGGRLPGDADGSGDSGGERQRIVVNETLDAGDGIVNIEVNNH